MKKVKNTIITLLITIGVISSSINVQAVETESKNKSKSKSIELIEKEDTLTGDDIVTYAKQFIGTPYKFGGTTKVGFDCSGFTMYVYNHFNIKLPHNAKSQASKGTIVSKSDLQIGDLLFFGKSINHVGIYVGNGKFIHSPKAGSKVRIEELKYMPNYNTAKRILSNKELD